MHVRYCSIDNLMGTCCDTGSLVPQRIFKCNSVFTGRNLLPSFKFATSWTFHSGLDKHALPQRHSITSREHKSSPPVGRRVQWWRNECAACHRMVQKVWKLSNPCTRLLSYNSTKYIEDGCKLSKTGATNCGSPEMFTGTAHNAVHAEGPRHMHSA
jgi:hypothetical protein